MSLALNIGEGTAGQLSPEHRDLSDGTKSFSTSFQRGPPSGFEIQGISRNRELPQSNDGKLAKFLFNMKSILLRRGILVELYFLVLGLMVSIAGSNYLYMLVVNDDKKCLELNEAIRTGYIVEKTLYDFYYMASVIVKLCIDLRSKASKKKKLWLVFLVDLLVVLPLVQVLLILYINKIMTRMNFMLVCDLFLFQYALRIIRMFPLGFGARTVANNPSDYFGILMLVGGIFASCYLQTARIIGDLWYFFAVKRLTACWEEACINHTSGCGSFYCHDGLANNTFLNEFCPTKTLNTTIYDFGIFFDALQSGIVDITTEDSERKIYALRWGLQNLSAFGQGLQTSLDVWENCFVLLITYFGVAFLIFSVGQLQFTVDYAQRGLFRMRLKNQKIKQWLPFRRISKNLQKQIKKQPPNNWELINSVNVENLLNNLSNDLKSDIKRELCLDLLKKVDEFENWDEITLYELCDCLRPAFYTERTRIVREGEPIDDMIFVLQGKLWAYSSSGTAITHQRTDHQPGEKDLFEEGDFFGGELVAWARDDASPSNLPVSTRILQAVTDVQAFVLIAYDLRKIFITHHQEHHVSGNLPLVSFVSSDQQQAEPEITVEEQ